MTAPYPLIFRPILLEKVWGGGALAALGKDLPPGKSIGESWELVDLSATSPSGAGGDAARSVIANGPLAGKTIQDVVRTWGNALLGRAMLTKAWGFPLLVKFLDARENLSVQVHPSRAYASKHPLAHLKTECWYVLSAEPGAVIYKGLKRGVTPETFERHVRDGSVVQDLVSVPAVPGEMHHLPSGTVHALGAGVVVAEIQTPSDTTFRLYDWGRTGREMHVEQGLACASFDEPPETTRLGKEQDRATLARTDLFAIDEVRVRGSPVTLPAECAVVLVVRGACKAGGAHALELPIGTTMVNPAVLGERTSITGSPEATCLVVTITRAR